eukprot:scaffold102260_cov13-Tisochrysis_lutea.AAC.1
MHAPAKAMSQPSGCEHANESMQCFSVCACLNQDAIPRDRKGRAGSRQRLRRKWHPLMISS